MSPWQLLRSVRLLGAGLSALLVVGLTLSGWPSITTRAIAAPPPSVTNTNDSGPGSLRQAIADAAAGGTITFSGSVTGTITLTSGELLVDKNLTIVGPGAAKLAINGSKLDRVFEIQSSTATISGLTITGGKPAAGENGGGILVDGGASLTLDASTVTQNAVIFSSTTYGGNGGGIYNGGTLVLNGSTVSDNTSSMTSGGTGAQGDLGAGIDNDYGATATLTDSTVSGNSSDYFGGGISNDGTMTLSASTVSGNSATNGGGGIFNDISGALTMVNSTIGDNNAAFGGGLMTENTLTAISSTISGNSGSGVYVVPSRFTTFSVTLRDTIVAAQASGAADCNVSSQAITDGGYNLASDTSCGWTQPTSQVVAGFPIGPLAGNGGPTQTMALPAGSTAIDVIPAGQCTDAGGNPLTTDQRGHPRPSPTNGKCDVGAFEYDGLPASPTPTITPTGTATPAQTPAATPGPGYRVYLPEVAR